MRRLLAWKELLKLGNVKFIRKEINMFFRSNLLHALSNEGWFETLRAPHSLGEFADNMDYTDLDLLQRVMEVLVNDNVLEMKEGRYYCGSYPTLTTTIPRVFTSSVVEIWRQHADFFPRRLKGEFMSFSSGINLFNWDDALTSRMYEQIRKSAFAFTGALNRGGKFLDVGSGNGYGTAAIWSYYARRNSNVQIYGIEPDEDLIRIASEEFSRMVSRHINHPINGMESPEFHKGSVEEIPFEDDTFDMVYASQVLHWTDAERAVKEMIRVAKPGGMVFGTQSFYPRSYPYNELHFFVVEGAGGFFSQDEFCRWSVEAGARKVSFATPISVFRVDL